MKYKLTLLTTAAAMATILTGCATSLNPFGNDHLTVTGTPAGFEEFFTGINGISQTAKNDDIHQLDNHHAYQAKKLQVRGLSLRLGKETDHAK